MLKKLYLSLALLAALFLAAGCGLPKKTELNERLIIEAVGIDSADGGFDVTVQALNDLAVGIEESAPVSGVTKCYLFHGATVGEALAQIAPQTGLTPLYSQARLLVIGFAAAKNDLCEALDFFLREHRTRADITVAAAEHTARELLTASFGKQRISAEILQSALGQNGSGGAPLTPLYRFMNLLLGESDAAFCPLLGLEPNPASDDYYVRCRGAILFQGTNYRTVIPTEDLFSLRLLTDGLSDETLPLTADGARFTLRIAQGRTKIRTVQDGATCRFQLRISVRCDIAEVSAQGFTPLTTEQIRTASAAASRLLIERLSGTLKRCFYENGCDVCRFYQRFRLRHPARYRAMTAAAPLSPVDFPCEIVCSVSIRRTGKEILRQD